MMIGLKGWYTHLERRAHNVHKQVHILIIRIVGVQILILVLQEAFERHESPQLVLDDAVELEDLVQHAVLL